MEQDEKARNNDHIHLRRLRERFRDENGCVGYIDYDIWEQAESDDWLEIDGKHYCPNCYEHDDDLDDYRPKTKQTDER